MRRNQAGLNPPIKTATRPQIIIFSGPPCSGKSTLARSLASRLDARHLQMDAIRSYLIPRSNHNQRDRDIAYRAMHLLAEELLNKRVTVIVDATYRRSEQRQQLESLAYRTSASPFLIQCKAPPEVAVGRFLRGRKDHAAVDLTPRRVRQFNEDFPYFDNGLVVDTTAEEADCIREIVKHIRRGVAMQLDGEWSRAGLPPSR